MREDRCVIHGLCPPPTAPLRTTTSHVFPMLLPSSPHSEPQRAFPACTSKPSPPARWNFNYTPNQPGPFFFYQTLWLLYFLVSIFSILDPRATLIYILSTQTGYPRTTACAGLFLGFFWRLTHNPTAVRATKSSVRLSGLVTVSCPFTELLAPVKDVDPRNSLTICKTHTLETDL